MTEKGPRIRLEMTPKDTKIREIVAANIRERRERAGLSYEDFAKRARFAEITVKKWEDPGPSGRMPMVKHLYRIADALGCKPGDLL